MTTRVLVIGGDAAGMSAAATAKRRGGDDLEVVVVERGLWTSYSACGIPYWIAGQVDGPDALVARTPEEHRERGIDVRTGTTATALDLASREVTVRADEGDERIGFDHLVLATGAEPVVPPVPGADAAGVHGVQTLDDGCRLLDSLGRSGVEKAVVVGAGYIGVEMADACLRRGLDTTLLDQAAEPMGTLDPELGRRVREAMQEMGVAVHMDARVEGFETGDGGRVRGVTTSDRTYDADIVMLGLGVRPRAALAAAADLPVGESGGVRTDPSMAVPGHPGVWAAGDCVEVWDRVREAYAHVPLGTHANKQGRVIGRNLTGGSDVFAGVVGTAVTTACGLEVGRSGLSVTDAEALGREVVSATVETATRAGYHPDAEPMTVRLTAEPGGRLLGGQLVGGSGTGLRVDIVATALWAGMTVADLIDLDLGYVPPLSSTWDPVQVAARALQSELR